MRPINEIIVHCSATRADWWKTRSLNQKVAEIRRWHVEDRGWSDIGYHFVFDRDGKMAEGRPLGRVGAHVRGHNTGTIGICLLGGHGSAETDRFEENFTPEQDRALRAQIAQLKHDYPTIKKISGHNEYAAKACPGFNVGKWWAAVPWEVVATVGSSELDYQFPKKPNSFAAFLEALLSIFRRR